MISLSASRPLSYSISPICYDIEGTDVQSIVDLVKVTSDIGSNIFSDFWEKDFFHDNQRPDLIGVTITNRQQIIPDLTLARNLRKRGHFVIVGGTLHKI